ncbi:hypothetical protein Q8A73_010340 [Channa argus]|nr:hypothetical protein Q8A73_010340 [Channa argus]
MSHWDNYKRSVKNEREKHRVGTCNRRSDIDESAHIADNTLSGFWAKFYVPDCMAEVVLPSWNNKSLDDTSSINNMGERSGGGGQPASLGGLPMTWSATHRQKSQRPDSPSDDLTELKERAQKEEKKGAEVEVVGQSGPDDSLRRRRDWKPFNNHRREFSREMVVGGETGAAAHNGGELLKGVGLHPVAFHFFFSLGNISQAEWGRKGQKARANVQINQLLRATLGPVLHMKAQRKCTLYLWFLDKV